MENIDTFAQLIIGKYAWLFAVGIAALIFKSSIEKFAASLFVFFGNDYKEDDVIYLDGRPGRIVRIAPTKTTFYLYDVVDGKIVGGTKLVIQNEKLSDLKIEKPLANLNLTSYRS